MALTPDQLTAIDRHLRKENWLLNEDLVAELTDHYANGIAEQLANGVPFELALIDIHKGFGGRKGLLKMEEEYLAEMFRAPALAFRKRLKTYTRWPKIVVPAAIIGLLFQIRGNPLIVNNMIISFCIFYTVRAVVTFYFLFRLNGWGKTSQHPVMKRIIRILGFQSANILLFDAINSASVEFQCLLLGIWVMELICTIDSLLSDQHFRKLFHIG
ncbi:hypothetical protein ACS5NO_09280 [Larkinella sp. GY13]|uniref:hypothetical protein n=1 Tax=Larkinella sp. GY13 TaxID=3453720 RepID=UPI003EEA83F5